jgi:hypothetical protein
MSEQMMVLGIAVFALAGLGAFLAAALKGWQGWLELKRLELAGGARRPVTGEVGERIEIADLRERIRKLESIAACIDL